MIVFAFLTGELLLYSNGQRFNTFDLGTSLLLGIPQVDRTLRVQPELRAIPEKP